MKRCYVLLLLAIAAIPGCVVVQKQERRNLDSGFYWGTESYWTRSSVPAEVFCSEASDPARACEDRSAAVFILFATHVKPGFTSSQMREALPETRWLEACSLQLLGGGGGQVDIDLFSGTPFILRVCPDEKGWSGWVITFTLTGGSSRHLLTVDDARRFLKGTHANRHVRLAEFNLFYPRDPHRAPPSFSERFTERGVGLKVR